MRKIIGFLLFAVICEAESLASFSKDVVDSDEGVKNNQQECVDLGLPSGLKWATCNIGANTPEEYGDYFAWGETCKKSEYTKANYQHLIDKYGNGYLNIDEDTIKTDISGTHYDVAHEKWGGCWRLPRLEEIKELIAKCTWEWTTIKGVNGHKVIGPNGNFIFLPAAGYRGGTSLYGASCYGCFWSSTPAKNHSDGAYGLYFYPGGSYLDGYGWWHNGYSVRPVTE